MQRHPHLVYYYFSSQWLCSHVKFVTSHNAPLSSLHSLGNSNGSVEGADRRIISDAPEAGNRGNDRSLTLRGVRVDGDGETDGHDDIAELGAQVSRGEDVSERASSSLARGNAKGSTDVVDALDVVGGVQGEGERGAGGDGLRC